MASEDTEITLGVGKLLGLFFLLVAFCGVFFSIGYSLGRNSGREEVLQQLPAQGEASTVPVSAPAGNNDDKPSAVVAVKSDSEQPSQEAPSSSQNPLTFYKAVQQVGVGSPVAQDSRPAELPKTEAKASPPPPPAATVQANSAAPPTATPAEATHTPAAAVGPVTGPGTIVVQIAAVMREDDAVALAGALRKKNYNVFVVNNPVTKDKFYHVQVGPFASLKDADAMKAKLVAEGYNPIVKK